MHETIEHRVLRSKHKENHPDFAKSTEMSDDTESEVILTVNGKVKSIQDQNKSLHLLPEFQHKEHGPMTYQTEPLQLPKFLYGMGQKVNAYKRFQ